MTSNSHGPMILRSDALPRVGGYVLHLYCKYRTQSFNFAGNKIWHDSDMHPYEITEADSRAGAVRIARQKGWVLHADGTSTCPHCARRIKAGEKPQHRDEEEPT